MTVSLFFILALTARLAASAPQIIPTNAAPPGPRTGLLVGQVVDAAGAPIPEAVVVLSMPRYLDNPTTPRGRVMADGEGRYFFADLPAGEYFLRASKEGYTGGGVGQREVSGPTQRLVLAEGERRTDAKLILWKFAAIGGTVLDEAGEPVVGVTVYALSRDVLGGRARYGQMTTAPYLVPTALTDDRGMFRLSQLIPASYVVVVPSVQTTVPVAILGAAAQNTTIRNELLRAVQPNGFSDLAAVLGALPLGQSRTQQIGDAAMVTMNGGVIPPPATSDGRMSVYRTTYYPSAMTADAGTLIALTSGDERTDVHLALRPVPAFRVSGRLVMPDGTAPPPTSMRLVGDSARDVADAGFETVNGMSDASGRFTLLGVTAGEYLLKNANTRFQLEAMRGEPTFWLQQRVTIDARDVDDLIVELRPTLRLGGRIEFRGAKGLQQAPQLSAWRVIFFESQFGEELGFGTEFQGDAFLTAAAPGQYVVKPRETPGWFVQSVTVDGKDITDRSFDLQTDTTSLVVVYTDRPSRVSGTVKDERGAASANALVLVFPTDPERWSGYGTSPRTVTRAPGTRTGGYTFAHLPPGEYYFVAIDGTGADADNWTDPKTLEALVGQATKLTIAAGEPKTVDLTLKAVR